MASELKRLGERRAAELQRVLGRHEKKMKASVSLSGELIRAADVIAGKAHRSAFVEAAPLAHLTHRRYDSAMSPTRSPV